MPPLYADDAEAVLQRVLRQLAKDLEVSRAPWPEDGFDGLVVQAARSGRSGGGGGHARWGW